MQCDLELMVIGSLAAEAGQSRQRHCLSIMDSSYADHQSHSTLGLFSGPRPTVSGTKTDARTLML